MKVTVKECLQLDCFKKSLVVPTEQYIENRVKNVSILDATSVEEAVKHCGIEGCLVLTSFSGMRNDLKLQIETVTALGKAKASAIAVFQRDERIKTIDPKIIDAADKAGMPLIIVTDDGDMGYSNVISEVMEKLLYGSSFQNTLINNTIYHLLNFERFASFPQALREAATANGFQVVILNESFNPVFSVETRHQTSIAEAIKLGKEASFGLGKMYSFIDVNGVYTYWGQISIGQEKYYLFLVDNEDHYTAGELTQLAEIIEIAMGMWKYKPERDPKAEFVGALMRGNSSLAQSIRKEADIKAQNIISVFHAKNVSDKESETLMDKFSAKNGIEILKVVEDEETYGIVFKSDEFKYSEEESERAMAIALFNELKAKESVKISHVTGIDGVEEASDAFRLIAETSTSVQSIFPYKRVYSRYELVLASNCASIIQTGGQLKKNYIELLEPFLKEKDNKSKQLLDTLETFILDAGMNSAKTAEFMKIHANTVQYRLKKINDILGAEITGNRVIPGLTVSLAIHRMDETNK